MRLVFVQNGIVQLVLHPQDIISIAKANIRKDWQTRILINNSEVEVGWVYNVDTGAVVPPNNN